jgi:hypothetical protein
LNQSLEKIIFIGLNLTLFVSVGVPLLLSTTQVITESEQQIAIQQFINEVDESVLFSDQNGIPVTSTIYVPVNVTVASQNHHLIFTFYYERWHTTALIYEHEVIVEGPTSPGPHYLEVTVDDVYLYVLFDPM